MRYSAENSKLDSRACVYLTVYSGNKLPPFYIGSTFLHRLNDGYKGTPSSRKYKMLWRKELKQNPQLFRTFIVKVLPSRSDALELEEKLQRRLRVVDNPLYVNCAYANGGFHNSDKSRDAEWRRRLAEAGRRISEERRRQIGAQAALRNKRIWTLKSPGGEIITTDSPDWPSRYNVNATSLYRTLRTNRPVSRGKTKGWQLLKVKKWTSKN